MCLEHYSKHIFYFCSQFLSKSENFHKVLLIQIWMTTKIINLETIKKMTDEALVSEFARTGQQDYFGELYNRYAHLSFGVCMKMLRNEEESRDVVSTVFMILHKKIPTSNILSFKKYLYTVSRNESLSRIRQRRSESEKLADLKIIEKNETNFMENEELIRLIDNEPSIEYLIGEAIKKLGEKQQKCIRLFFFENKSYKEIVDMTEFNLKEVKSFLQNGKRKLKIYLQDLIQ